jgi:hypothetical protein
VETILPFALSVVREANVAEAAFRIRHFVATLKANGIMKRAPKRMSPGAEDALA